MALCSAAVNSSRYLVNRAVHLAPGRAGLKPKILFCVPFYGYSGGSYAVLSTADLLCAAFDVSFLTKPTNVMNRYVSTRVRMVSDIADRYDYCIVEGGADIGAVGDLKRRGTRIIMTMHGAPPTKDGTKNHGYSDEQIAAMMQLADSAQYISDVQLPFFENFPALHRRKISNFVLPVQKRRRSGAAGVVCDTTLAHKNADAAIRAAQLSKASAIEVWGNHNGKHSTARVHWNGFCRDKQQIYDSFDVLVHMSELENQPLVILEALSAGVPCVLAPLPTYQFLRSLDGVFFAAADDPAAVAGAIDRALDCPLPVRQGLEKFWRDNHSPAAIQAKWVEYLADLRKS